MSWSVAGITAENVRLVKLALAAVHDKLQSTAPLQDSDEQLHDLSTLYLLCVDLLDHFMNALYTEMFSTRTEIMYWEKYHKSSSWEKRMVFYNHKLYSLLRRLVRPPKADELQLIHQDLEAILYYVESLKSDFNELAVLLAKITKMVSYLQSIGQVLEENRAVARNRTESNGEQLPLGSPKQNTVIHRSLSRQEVCAIHASVKRALYCLLQEFSVAMHTHSVKLLRDNGGHEQVIGALKRGEDCDVLLLEGLAAQYIYALQGRQTWSLLNPTQHYYDRDSFPLGLTKRWVSRPSSREQHFIRNTLCLTGASIAFYHYLLPFVLDRELLHAKVQAFTEFVVGKVQEKVVEPLEELAQELFDTIRSRETIVTKRDLELSKQSLERMLQDFSSSNEGLHLIFPDLSMEEVKKRLLDNELVNTFKPSSRGASAPVEIPAKEVVASPPVAPAVRSGGGGGAGQTIDDLVVLRPSAEQAMQALMREYEKELQTPIRGIIFGSLFTAILIQMQKLKVHTEAAMLTMDQILASNELTIAATAALPALGLFGFLLFRLRGLFSAPSASVPATHCLHLRMILADVDRAYDVLLASILACDLDGSSKSALMSIPYEEPMSCSSLLSQPIPLSPARLVREMSDKADESEEWRNKKRQVLVAEGLCYFHARRLRYKVQEALRFTQPQVQSAMKKAMQQAQQVLQPRTTRSLSRLPSCRTLSIEGREESLPLVLWGAASSVLQSLQELASALYGLLVGHSTDLSPGETAMQMSLERDLCLLETPFHINIALARAMTLNSSLVMNSSMNRDFAVLWHGVKRKQSVTGHMKSSYPWFVPSK